MDKLSLKHQIREYQKRAFHSDPQMRVHTLREAIDFVEARGFVFFWKIKGIPFPSLWEAVAGNRPVASNHDDPGHITWKWKDAMLGKKQWYYAKVLRHKATMISRKYLPAFYALSANFGSPEEDYLIQYLDGMLSQAEKRIYEILLSEGAQDTQTLRRKSMLSTKYEFERALVRLQADFRVLPVGTRRAGNGWNILRYDLVHRAYPALPEEARLLSQTDARMSLLMKYFENVGGAQPADVSKLFRWQLSTILPCLQRLTGQGFLRKIPAENNQKPSWYVLSSGI